uniref:SCP domain-containing protein n=1 Tax=Globodera pallida TaxID=36090 RepID=A0A183CDG5_GLOPA
MKIVGIKCHNQTYVSTKPAEAKSGAECLSRGCVVAYCTFDPSAHVLYQSCPDVVNNNGTVPNPDVVNNNGTVPNPVVNNNGTRPNPANQTIQPSTASHNNATSMPVEYTEKPRETAEPINNATKAKQPSKNTTDQIVGSDKPSNNTEKAEEKTTVTAPLNNTEKPAKLTTAPLNNTEKPAKLTTASIRITTAPLDDTVETIKMSTASIADTEMSMPTTHQYGQATDKNATKTPKNLSSETTYKYLWGIEFGV